MAVKGAGCQQGGGAKLEDPLRAPKVFFASGLAGAVSRTATAPVDRLRMLLICEEGRKPLTLYEGLKKMSKEGSIQSYFKGNGANVMKIVPETAIKLTAADMIKNVIAQDPHRVQVHERFISGALGGALSQFTIYPLEVVRTRLATCTEKKSKGIWCVSRTIYLEQGFRGFYRGLTPAMLGILPYAGVDITCFEIMKEALVEMHYPNKPPDMFIIGAGMLSSCVAQVVSFPLNMIRTRLQAQKPEPYANMWDAYTKTVRKEGYRGLYKGLLPNMVKLAPAQGISWYVYYKTRILLGVTDLRRQVHPQRKTPLPPQQQQQQQQQEQIPDGISSQQPQQLLIQGQSSSSGSQKQQQQQQQSNTLEGGGLGWGNVFMIGVMLSPLIMYGVMKNWRRIQYRRQMQQYKVMGI
eukprot:TRINITY_DN655_c0_g1_i2.p1 TRINITY_DN655_c0_g1~~TRINITY_DN655_c0_g1_i2.p1  ORF type:complete len:408 (+),score=59.68 TRINITY_DN655_c0_g1_i2:284-1507(+)